MMAGQSESLDGYNFLLITKRARSRYVGFDVVNDVGGQEQLNKYTREYYTSLPSCGDGIKVCPSPRNVRKWLFVQ